ncbi:MAG: hypothetical protein J5590_10095 [Clostridia bacterium]|nr:hypothetical protein [Clostridia bacterium]
MFNSVIKSNDTNAVAKLNENIESNEKRLSYMQSVNDYYTVNGTTAGYPEIDDEQSAVLDAKVKDGQKTPYPGQFFTDNRKEIDRLKAIIDRLQNKPETVFQSWQFSGGEAVVNLANNRLQLVFEEKPSDERIGVLKQNGFKWAPKGKAWQRPLTNQTMSVCDKIGFIKPLDGRKPTDIQPKAPKKNEPER